MHLNFVWVILASILVLIMQAGFAALEAGMTRAKNSIKIYPLRVSREDEEAGLNVSEHGERIAMVDSIIAMQEIAAAKGDLTKTLRVEPGEDTAELHHALYVAAAVKQPD